MTLKLLRLALLALVLAIPASSRADEGDDDFDDTETYDVMVDGVLVCEGGTIVGNAVDCEH